MSSTVQHARTCICYIFAPIHSFCRLFLYIVRAPPGRPCLSLERARRPLQTWANQVGSGTFDWVAKSIAGFSFLKLGLTEHLVMWL